MARSSGRSRHSRRRNVDENAPGPSYVELALSLLQRALFYIISLIFQMLPNELKSKIITRILEYLIRHFLSNDKCNLWDRLLDHVKSHHSFHTACPFTHVGRGVLPKVRNQGKLAACFIFSTCGAVSSLITRLKKIHTVLAVQQLIDHFNITEYDGGTTSEAYDFIMNNGVMEEEYYPFTGGKETLQNPACRRFFIGGHRYLGRTSSDVDKKEFKRSPVTASMPLYTVFNKYEKGIFDAPREGKLAGVHSVLITGFGISKKSRREYFEIQNSYGYDWGRFGSGKVFADLLYDFRVPISAGADTIVDS